MNKLTGPSVFCIRRRPGCECKTAPDYIKNLEEIKTEIFADEKRNNSQN